MVTINVIVYMSTTTNDALLWLPFLWLIIFNLDHHHNLWLPIKRITALSPGQCLYIYGYHFYMLDLLTVKC